MGETIISWETFDRPHHDRGPLWFVLAALAGLGLLIYAVASANFLFAFIIILFALVTYLSSQGEPTRIRASVTDTGIRLGTDTYRFRDIRRFWFVYQPPEVKVMYFETGSWVHPRISIELEDMNPNDIRTVVGKYVREDLEMDEEPVTDYVSRVLKL